MIKLHALSVLRLFQTSNLVQLFAILYSHPFPDWKPYCPLPKDVSTKGNVNTNLVIILHQLKKIRFNFRHDIHKIPINPRFREQEMGFHSSLIQFIEILFSKISKIKCFKWTSRFSFPLLDLIICTSEELKSTGEKNNNCISSAG